MHGIIEGFIIVHVWLAIALVVLGLGLILIGLGPNKLRPPHYRPTRFWMMGLGVALLFVGLLICAL